MDMTARQEKAATTTHEATSGASAIGKEPTLASPDLVVRDYLAELTDPDTRIDPATVAAAEKQLAEAKDPLERVLAQQALIDSKNPPSLEPMFVQHAKTWADQKGVSREALAAVGVSEHVLNIAGFPRRNGKKTTTSDSGRIPRDLVMTAVLDQPGDFTVRGIMEASEASQATVRKAVNDLLADGRIEISGVEEVAPGTPGRAPNTYRVVSVPAAAPNKTTRSK